MTGSEIDRKWYRAPTSQPYVSLFTSCWLSSRPTCTQCVTRDFVPVTPQARVRNTESRSSGYTPPLYSGRPRGPISPRGSPILARQANAASFHTVSNLLFINHRICESCIIQATETIVKYIKKNEVKCMTHLPANADILTLRNRVLLEMLIVVLLVKKLSSLYGTQRSIMIFTRARHRSLCGIRWIHSIVPHPVL
jgi:hypothetical protein